MHKSIAFSLALPLASLLGACASGPASETGADPGASPVTTDPTSGSALSPAGPSAPAASSGRSHRRCGWVFTSEPAGADAFVKNAAHFDAIHPVWGALQQDGMGVQLLADVDDPAVLEAARKNHVAVIPTVASVDHTDWTRTMLEDSNRRAAHVKALVDLAVSHQWDGLDLDYEHLWDPADRAPLQAFIEAFSVAMHAAGKEASMAVPALFAPSPVWSYADLEAALDHVHVMSYDFHYVGGPHAGPTAPLGWVDAVAAYAAAAGPHPERFILGLPNYGVSAGTACDLGDCAAHCRAPAAPDAAEMSACSENGERFTPGRVLACDSDLGRLYFDDAASIGEKVDIAHARGLGGVAYWKLGGEPAGFFEAIAR